MVPGESRNYAIALSDHLSNHASTRAKRAGVRPFKHSLAVRALVAAVQRMWHKLLGLLRAHNHGLDAQNHEEDLEDSSGTKSVQPN